MLYSAVSYERRLVRSCDLQLLCRGSVATRRISEALQIKNQEPDQEKHPGQGWGEVGERRIQD